MRVRFSLLLRVLSLATDRRGCVPTCRLVNGREQITWILGPNVPLHYVYSPSSPSLPKKASFSLLPVSSLPPRDAHHQRLGVGSPQRDDIPT